MILLVKITLPLKITKDKAEAQLHLKLTSKWIQLINIFRVPSQHEPVLHFEITH